MLRTKCTHRKYAARPILQKSSWRRLASDQGGELVVNQPGPGAAQVVPEGAGQGGGFGVQRQGAFGRPGNGWPAAGLLKCLKLRQEVQAGTAKEGRSRRRCFLSRSRLLRLFKPGSVLPGGSPRPSGGGERVLAPAQRHH